MRPILMLILMGVARFTFAADALPTSTPPEFVESRLTGRVTDQAGASIAGAKIIINRRSGARTDGRPHQAVADANGSYEILVRFVKGKSLLVHEVFADAVGYVRAANAAPIRLLGGETVALPLVLTKGEIFAGVLRVPLTEMELLSRRKPEDIQRMLEVDGPALEHLPLNGRTHVARADGKFECWVPPGEYIVRLHGYSTEPVEWPNLESGRQDIVLEMPEFDWSQEALGKVFDQFWQAMDRSYSYFFLKTNVDWKMTRDQHRPKVVQAKNTQQLADALMEMLRPLQDLHVRLETPSGTLPTYRIPWTYNGNLRLTLDAVEGKVECGEFATVGRSRGDGFGCLIIRRQTEANPANVAMAVEAVKKLRDAPGFMVDLRRANGGSEPLAMELAKLFCARETVYAKSKYRNGPGHDDFGRDQERLLAAVPDPYTKPVVCLIGQGAVSSGEGFAKMMKCLPQVTMIGLSTRGASGNPKPWPLAGTKVTVYFSRWVDLMPDGTTFEDRGIPPDITVALSPASYADSDPTWGKGLEVLRQKVAPSIDRHH